MSTIPPNKSNVDPGHLLCSARGCVVGVPLSEGGVAEPGKLSHQPRRRYGSN